MSSSAAFIVGNWKLNGTGQGLGQIRSIAEGVQDAPSVRVAICPPATLLSRAAQVIQGSKLSLGGQDCHPEINGAFTGDISAEMLADAGAQVVILGHSERRAAYGETNTLVASKVSAALRAGLEPIICVGESLTQRRSGEALRVVVGQVVGSLPSEAAHHRFAVAYEPVWAIGTGLTPTLNEIEEVHLAIRSALKDIFGPAGLRPPILYGGSVKPDNAAEILKGQEVGGALVGGASLKAEDFLAIVGAV
ncbi:MAG: triose-phosphate isomerase [Phenylobacterium zucineum]|nr:MAG: triose-phosphate isomerase [Phenylobacterium zucineum]